MKIFAAFLIIMFLAFSGYHLTFRSFRLPLIAKRFYLTGTEYLFLGLLLGPFFLNLLDQKTLTSLEPISTLLLGWVGLLCGFQFEIRELKRFPKTYLSAAVIESLITFVTAASAIYFLIPLWFDITETLKIITSISLGAAASCTAQTGLALLTAKAINKRSEFILFLRYISSIDSLMALFFFTPVFFVLTQNISQPPWFTLSGFTTFVLVIANISLILLYNLFLAQRRNKNELMLVIIGMVVLTSGTAATFHFSPLLANFFIGIFIVNTTREKERIFSIVVNAEKPLYLLLLVFIGAYWRPDSLPLFSLAMIYCFVRLAGKFTGGFLASKISYKKSRFPVISGFALIEQGGIPLAIIFDFQQNFTGELTTQIASFAIIAIVINDLISPLFIQSLLDKEVK